MIEHYAQQFGVEVTKPLNIRGGTDYEIAYAFFESGLIGGETFIQAIHDWLYDLDLSNHRCYYWCPDCVEGWIDDGAHHDDDCSCGKTYEPVYEEIL